METKYLLENVSVETPCSADWNEMMGNEEVRHCHQCQRNIHNISEMPKRRALKVLNQKDEIVCISYFKDEKNKIITQTYFGIFRRNLVKTISTVLALIFSFTSIYAIQTNHHKSKKRKVIKHRKHKKTITPPKLIVGKRVVGLRPLP